MTTWHKVLIGGPIRATPCSGVLKEITHPLTRAPNRLFRVGFYAVFRTLSASAPEATTPGTKEPRRSMIDGVRCGRCRIRTYVGSRRQIYSLLPLAARAICLVRRLRCAEKLTTNPPRQCKLPAQHPCEQWCGTGAGTTVSVAGRPPAPEFVGPSWTGAQCG